MTYKLLTRLSSAWLDLRVLFKIYWICSSNLKFGSKGKPKCFLSWIWLTWLSLKFNDGYSLETSFWPNSNCWTCLKRTKLKSIFHCTAHSEILVRSWFKLRVLALMFCTKENKAVSSAKSFRLDCQPFGKSFM